MGRQAQVLHAVLDDPRLERTRVLLESHGITTCPKHRYCPLDAGGKCHLCEVEVAAQDLAGKLRRIATGLH
ncbi:MAG TPA: hypothetical protein VN739_01265 [Nitrososphaerales archaeon]|nr:hypothetical protein [Nitrososphaerales archaeon]